MFRKLRLRQKKIFLYVFSSLVKKRVAFNYTHPAVNFSPQLTVDLDFPFLMIMQSFCLT